MEKPKQKKKKIPKEKVKCNLQYVFLYLAKVAAAMLYYVLKLYSTETHKSLRKRERAFLFEFL